MRLDGAYKQSKDIDSDNKDDLSGEEPHGKVGLKPPGRPVRHNIASQDLSVPVPIRGSLMSDKSRNEEWKNAQGDIEVQAVETIEEFFRPEFAQNNQSLDDINDDSDENDVPIRGSVFSNKERQASKFKMPQFSEDDSEDDGNSVTVDIGNDNNKANFRNMGFPNMNYLDPDAHGPPVQDQTFYKDYEENQENDIKRQR